MDNYWLFVPLFQNCAFNLGNELFKIQLNCLNVLAYINSKTMVELIKTLFRNIVICWLFSKVFNLTKKPNQSTYGANCLWKVGKIKSWIKLENEVASFNVPWRRTIVELYSWKPTAGSWTKDKRLQSRRKLFTLWWLIMVFFCFVF